MHVYAGLGGLDESQTTAMWNEDRLHKFILDSFSTSMRPNEAGFRFLFVRHPFERLAAAYHDKFVVRRENSFIQPLIAWMKRRQVYHGLKVRY